MNGPVGRAKEPKGFYLVVAVSGVSRDELLEARVRLLAQGRDEYIKTQSTRLYNGGWNKKAGVDGAPGLFAA